MAVVEINMFSFRDCARCGHEPEYHSLTYQHYGCDCRLNQYRPGVELWVAVKAGMYAFKEYGAGFMTLDGVGTHSILIPF